MSKKLIDVSNLGAGFVIDFLKKKIHIKEQFHILPKTYFENDTKGRSFTTKIANGFTTQEVVIRNGFECKYHYELPCRNDSESWGGGYTYLHISVNGGAPILVGHSGYQNAMVYKARAIRTDTKTVVLSRGLFGIPKTGDYKIKVTLKHKSYNGTLLINKSSGTSTSQFLSYHEFQEIIKG